MNPAPILWRGKRRVDVPSEWKDRGLAGGFEAYLQPRADEAVRERQPFRPSGPRYAEHHPRRRIEPRVHIDKPTERPSPREGGRRHVPAYTSGEVLADKLPKLRKVVDPRTGDLARNRSSSEYDFKDLYGRVRVCPDKRQFSHGIFPACHNYPPSRDGDGRPIDYSLARHGGPFALRVVRLPEAAAAAAPVAHTRATLKNGAAQRAREAALLRSLKPAPAAAHSRPPSTASSASVRQSLARSSSVGALGSSRRPPLADLQSSLRQKDAKIAQLQARLQSLKQGGPGK